MPPTAHSVLLVFLAMSHLLLSFSASPSFLRLSSNHFFSRPVMVGSAPTPTASHTPSQFPLSPVLFPLLRRPRDRFSVYLDFILNNHNHHSPRHMVQPSRFKLDPPFPAPSASFPLLTYVSPLSPIPSQAMGYIRLYYFNLQHTHCASCLFGANNLCMLCLKTFSGSWSLDRIVPNTGNYTYNHFIRPHIGIFHRDCDM